RVEGRAHALRGQLDAELRLPGRLEQHELRHAALGLLVAGDRRPGAVAVDLHRLWREELLHLGGNPGVEAEVLDRQLRRGEQAERDRLAVARLPVRACRLERVRERMPEVEHVAFSLVAWIAQADARLVGGARAHEPLVVPLPEVLSRYEPRLDDLRYALAPLRLRQGLQERRVDDDPRRPVV